MRRVLAGLIALFVLAICGAATAAATCAGPEKAAGKALLYYSNDDPIIDGLATSLRYGLEPPSSPSDAIARHPDACVRQAFSAGGQSWTLRSAGYDAPPRWATSETDKARIAFLVALPRPEAAYAWAQASRRAQGKKPEAKFTEAILALAVAEGDHRRIYGFYDDIPDDVRLTGDMRTALEGRSPVLATYDFKTHQPDLFRVLGPMSWTYIDTKGKVEPVDFKSADGAAFTAGADGSARAAASGLNCPAVVAGFERTSLTVSGARDGAHEVGCRYAAPASRMSVIATNIPGRKPDDVLNAMFLGAAGGDEGAAAAESTLPGVSDDGYARVAFNAADGARLSLWVTRRGDWYFEIYMLHGVGDEDVVGAAVTALKVSIPGS